jgi:hypothetical protein
MTHSEREFAILHALSALTPWSLFVPQEAGFSHVGLLSRKSLMAGITPSLPSDMYSNARSSFF